QIEQRAVGCDHQALVIAFGNRDRHKAIRQSRQVDAVGLGRLGRLAGLGGFACLRAGLLAAVVLVAVVGVLVLVGLLALAGILVASPGFLIAGPGRERRLAIGGEHRRVDTLAQ